VKTVAVPARRAGLDASWGSGIGGELLVGSGRRLNSDILPPMWDRSAFPRGISFTDFRSESTSIRGGGTSTSALGVGPVVPRIRPALLRRIFSACPRTSRQPTSLISQTTRCARRSRPQEPTNGFHAETACRFDSCPLRFLTIRRGKDSFSNSCASPSRCFFPPYRPYRSPHPCLHN
jgi:hypothetical protein